jgi:lipopolysaccharide biosynthesis glycosyltransferase
MMVLNLVRWRQIGARGILVNTAYSMVGKLNDPDQDVLNICFHDQYVPLDYIWNAISPFFKEVNHLALSGDEIARVVKDVRIVHFNGVGKPWQYLCFHPYAKRYLQCVAKTDWKGFKQADFNLINVLKKIVISRLGERRSAALSQAVRRLRPITPGYRN